MANEFVARLGLIARESSQMSGSLNVTGSLKVTGSAHIQSASIDNVTVSNMSATGVITANAYLSAGANAVVNNLSQLVFSNSNNVSFGINAGTITATAAGGAAELNVSAGTTSNNVSQLVFSNANGIEFGLNGSTITARKAIDSYYYNVQPFQGSGNTLTLGGSSAGNFVQPFLLPYDVSIGYIRVLLTNSYVSTTLVSTANTSAALTYAQTFFANIYTRGTGASSLSLQQLAGSSATVQMRVAHTIGAASNNQSQTVQISYPVAGESSTYSSTTAPGTANSIVVLTVNLFVSFNTNRYLDIPFATSLAAGNYWIGFNKSTSSASNFASYLNNVIHNNSLYFATQINSNFAQYGAASNVSSQPLFAGHGSYSVSANGATTSTIGFANISSAASHPIVPFQFIRVA